LGVKRTSTGANAKLLFKALAAGEAYLDEPIPDGRIMDVAGQIGLEGDEFDSALDYAADQAGSRTPKWTTTPAGFRSRLLVWPPRDPNPTARNKRPQHLGLGSFCTQTNRALGVSGGWGKAPDLWLLWAGDYSESV
jgi:hypothetical protein